MNFRIRDIYNFVATSDCRTLVEAALKLEISQPALSESIQRLERDLGSKVFYRSRTGISLTPSGKLFLKKSTNAIRALECLSLDEKEEESMFGLHSVTIGCHPIVAQYTLPAALKKLSLDVPHYQFHFVHALSRDIQNKIQRGEVDIGIVVNPVKVPDIVIKKIATDTVSVWGTSHLRGQSVHENTLFCNTELFQTQSILKRLKKKPSRVVHTENLELICRFVAQGLGLGIIPRKVTTLYNLPLEEKTNLAQFKDEICLVHRPEFGKTRGEKAIRYALSLT